jgi:hypothetical protein
MNNNEEEESSKALRMSAVASTQNLFGVFKYLVWKSVHAHVVVYLSLPLKEAKI